MITNRAGLDIIKEFEGLELDAYQCPAGVWTIGYGHTEGVKPGDKIDQVEASRLLKHDIIKFEHSVESLVRVPLTENMFSALVSFTYNLGGNNLAKSTLLKELNQRHYGDAANQFLVWIMISSKPSKGLLRRRIAERKLFLS